MSEGRTRDLTLAPDRAGLLSVPVSIAMIAAVVGPHLLVHGENPLREAFQLVGGWGVAAVLIAGIALHELIHGVSWKLAGRLAWSDLRFGVNWRALMPYAHPRRPVPVSAYALGAAAPGIVLGVVPAIYGLATGNGPASGWGAIFFAAACGDALVLWTLRGLAPATLVQDHPIRVGCEVVG